MCPGGSARGGGRAGLPVVFGDPPAHGEAGPGAEALAGKGLGLCKAVKRGQNPLWEVVLSPCHLPSVCPFALVSLITH